LFAAAEASFLYAQRSGKPPYYLATALYAWAYLFPEDASEAPNRFDPRLQLAANLYNRGLTNALESEDRRQVILRGGVFELPFGKIDVEFDPAQLRWQGREMKAFGPIAEFKVVGLQAFYREPGIGAPLVATLAPLPGETDPHDLLRPDLTIPVTAILRSPRSRTKLAWPPLEGALEVHLPDVTGAVDVAGQHVPLESDPTAVLAYSLADSPIWDQEYRRFFDPLQFGKGDQSELYATVPHRRGRMPVVFVHGTASSFGRWAEMYNRLAADPRLRARYEFWFFSYDSGSPITWSATLLRESLLRAVKVLDPDGTDPGLQRMVVIGHSQGGLLTKMTVIDSGSRFWDLNFKKPLESLDVSPETHDLLLRTTFVKPLPCVKRVIFLATPHGGSELTVGRTARWIAGFVKAPIGMAEVMTDLVTKNRDALVLSTADSRPRVPTSMDQMNPHNRFLLMLHAIPIAPGVAAHSIIAVKTSGPVEDGEDGVVAYRSAHIEGVESELVVHSGHSLQDKPETVEEVRRILLLHAAEVDEH
ncbi:MAG TPA: alpha/beta fold hydrolase, partial [Candidatus Methylomirabilis sp.]|nr:alpha/beta fold hydrolase [Candidatus Methylomirabilis sp.]